LPSAGAAVGSVARGASAPTEEGERRGISWRPPGYSLLKLLNKHLDTEPEKKYKISGN